MHSHSLLFIQDLAIILVISGIITVVFHRLNQPVVLGYILAGIIIGPYTPPFSFIYNTETIKTLAELGVIFLMFSLGLEFDLHKLKKVGAPAFLAALTEILLMTWIGYEIGLLFKWTHTDAIFLGTMLAISSTTIIVKALEENSVKKQKFAQLIFGILIIEDIFAIGILALLSGMATTGTFHFDAIFITILKLVSFLVISLVAGILLIPRLLNTLYQKNKNQEMLLIAVLGLCFGFCLIVIKLDYSIALGAFIIGAIIAESRQLILIEQIITPLKDMFSAIFFVSIGLMFNPKILIDYALPIFVITLAVVVGKILTCSISTFLTGENSKTSIRVGMGLAQIGEFSFIIASLGLTLNLTSHFLFPIAVAVSSITTFLTPYLIRHSDTFEKGISIIIPKKIPPLFTRYTLWIQSIRQKSNSTEIKKIIHVCLWQIVINFFIIIAIFLSCAFLTKTQWGKLLATLTSLSIQKTILWSCASLLALPSLIAIYRKVMAISMLLVEISIKKHNSKQFIQTRTFVSIALPILVLIGIFMIVATISTTILPPIKSLLLITLIILIIILFFNPWFIKLHALLQIKFLETMKRNKKK